MRCQSASSILTDAYHAGLEVGGALRSGVPEVVLLLASIHHGEASRDLFDGLHDGLGTADVPIFGATGDGIYESSRLSHHGVCALGLNSGGQVRWHLAVRAGAGADSRAAARACGRDVVRQAGGALDFAWVFADGMRADGTRVVEGFSDTLGCPFAGGLAGDDRKFERSFVFADGRAWEDAVAVLGARGPLDITLNAASGWTPVGRPGVIDKCNGNTVARIGGATAQGFLRAQLGKTVGERDLGIVPLAAYQPGDGRHFFLRTPSSFDPATGEISIFGSLDPGVEVRVCTATRDEVLRGVETAIAGARREGWQPAAAVIISCAGRKWVLEERWREEIDRMLAAFGPNLPLIGFPSFGEIGPYRREDGTYTPSFFHNATFVLCLIGGREAGVAGADVPAGRGAEAPRGASG